MNNVYTIKLVCLETNKVIESFSSKAIGIVEKKASQWYQTKTKVKVEYYSCN